MRKIYVVTYENYLGDRHPLASFDFLRDAASFKSSISDSYANPRIESVGHRDSAPEYAYVLVLFVQSTTMPAVAYMDDDAVTDISLVFDVVPVAMSFDKKALDDEARAIKERLAGTLEFYKIAKVRIVGTEVK